jgi:ectoine hydroxylase
MHFFKMQSASFTIDDLAAYDGDGYLLVPQLFDPDEIKLLRDTAKRDRALDQQAFGRNDGEGGNVRLALWNHPGDDLYGMFSRNERIVARVEQLLSDEPYHYHSKMIMKEARTPGPGIRTTATGTTTACSSQTCAASS